jgi:hypothetical protein
MTSMAGTRRLGPWLLGLFLIAQIFGVPPLVGGHAAHVAGIHSVLLEPLGVTVKTAQAHHKTGDADGSDQHHALHDLNGVLADSVDRHATALVRVVAPKRASNALVAADPVLLERPPKSRLSV